MLDFLAGPKISSCAIVDSTLTFTTGSDVTTISGNEIQSGNVKISGNTITTTSGNLNLDSFLKIDARVD